MPRPKILRRVRKNPEVLFFKPAGIKKSSLEEVTLEVDEFEALKYVDFEEKEQILAAKKMNVSQPTFSRLLKSGRKKITDAIVNGKAIKIEGGNYKTL
jgi:predicted DNA-binding protein (UPF0251 family)